MEISYRAMLRGWDRMGRATCGTEVMLKLTQLMKRSFHCHLALSYSLHLPLQLTPSGCCGLPPGAIRTFLQHPLPLPALPLLQDIVERRHRLLISGDVPAGLFPAPVAELFPPGALLGLPIQARGELVGVAFALRDHPFSHKEAALMGWTVSHAALALRSFPAAPPVTHLTRQLEPKNLDIEEGSRSMLVSTVSTLLNAIEAKSSWTKGHSERVMRTSAIIAAGVGLDEAAVERVRLAGLLHDIGKIGVEGGLDYPGRLDWDADPPMKHHPEKGVAILAPIEELKGVLPGILHHHERFDGNGYPAGLRGQEIPIDARIIAVADAFDAMVSERPYKSGSLRADALAELEGCAGTQFDPEMVRCLTGFMKEEAFPLSPPPRQEAPGEASPLSPPP
jgi:HD-GYP domain-containing protein (c-di-GMP phosphodiesterase class II)